MSIIESGSSSGATHSLWEVMERAAQPVPVSIPKPPPQASLPRVSLLNRVRRWPGIRRVDDALATRQSRRTVVVLIVSTLLHVVGLYILARIFLPTDVVSPPMATTLQQLAAEPVDILQTEPLVLPRQNSEQKAKIVHMEAPSLTADVTLPNLARPAVAKVGKAGPGGGNGQTRGRGLGGGQLFGGTDGARSIVFVVDRSGSMRGMRWQVVREQLDDAIGHLRFDQSYEVLVYNDRVLRVGNTRGDRLVDVSNRVQNSRLRARLQRIQPIGNTEGERAMLAALRIHPDLVIFLTDGAFQISKRKVARARRKNTQINVVIIGHAASGDMKEIVSASGGTLRIIAP